VYHPAQCCRVDTHRPMSVCAHTPWHLSVHALRLVCIAMRIRSCTPARIGSYTEMTIRAWPDERMERCAYRRRRVWGHTAIHGCEYEIRCAYTPTTQHGRTGIFQMTRPVSGFDELRTRAKIREVCFQPEFRDGNVQAFRGRPTGQTGWRAMGLTLTSPAAQTAGRAGACQPLL
jgi:hypothetical protein